MKKIVLILIILIPIISFGQDWQLFPEGQRNFYTQENDDSEQVIHSVKLNYIEIDDSVEVLHYDKVGDFAQACIDRIEPLIVEIELSEEVMSQSFHEKIRSLNRIGNNYTYAPNFEGIVGDFVFHTDAVLDDSWQTINNTLTITCIAVQQQMIFGEMEDVKVFLAVGGNYGEHQIILSRTHGLIEFIPFYAYFKTGQQYEPYYLDGYSNDLGDAGNVISSWRDYFPMQVGDVKYWEYIYNPGTPNFYKNYEIVTYMDRFDTDSSIVFEVEIKEVDANFNLINTSLVTVTRIENVMLNTKTSYWYFGPGNGFELTNNGKITIDQNLVYEFETYSEPLHVESSGDSCEIEHVINNGNSYNYNTYQGATAFYAWSYENHSSSNLVGSTINGVTTGETITIPIVEPTLSGHSVYPNPSNDVIFIELPNQTSSSKYDLYNNLGQIIMSDYLNGKIDISSLHNGIYNLKIDGYKNVKIIKI